MRKSRNINIIVTEEGKEMEYGQFSKEFIILVKDILIEIKKSKSYE